VIGVGQLVCRGAKCLGVSMVSMAEFEDCNESIQFNHPLLPAESIVI